MDNHPPEELKEQVLEFQSALIHNADRRRKTQISIYNPRHAKMLNNIWEAANVQDIPIPGAKKWRKLGFSASSSMEWKQQQQSLHCISILVRGPPPRIWQSWCIWFGTYACICYAAQGSLCQGMS